MLRHTTTQADIFYTHLKVVPFLNTPLMTSTQRNSEEDQKIYKLPVRGIKALVISAAPTGDNHVIKTSQNNNRRTNHKTMLTRQDKTKCKQQSHEQN